MQSVGLHIPMLIQLAAVKMTQPIHKPFVAVLCQMQLFARNPEQIDKQNVDINWLEVIFVCFSKNAKNTTMYDSLFSHSC